MTPATGRAPGFTEFVALLAILFATIAFSIDAMLPALTTIGAELSPEAVNRAQLVVTSFILGMGVGTFVVGPLSDALGRRRVVMGGIAIYLLAALVAAQAGSLDVLLAARFLQGLGASAPRIVTVAMVRDLYEGRAMARVMSIVMTVFLVVPALAPSLGAAILWAFDWRAIFWAFCLFGLTVGSWFFLRQPETLPPHRRRPLRPRLLAQAVAEVLADRVARRCMAALTLSFGVLLSFLSTAPQIYDEVYGRAAQFPLWFAVIAVISSGASVTNARLVMRLGMRRMALTAFALQIGAAAVMLAALALPLSQDVEFAVFFGFMTVVFFGVTLTFGNLNAIALEKLGHIAGLAASVIGALYTVGAVLVAVPVGQLYAGTPLPLAGAALVFAIGAFLLVRSLPVEARAPVVQPPL